MTRKPRGRTMAGLSWRYGFPLVLVAFALGWALLSSRDATGGPPRALCGRCARVAVHECPADECDIWQWHCRHLVLAAEARTKRNGPSPRCTTGIASAATR